MFRHAAGSVIALILMAGPDLTAAQTPSASNPLDTATIQDATGRFAYIVFLRDTAAPKNPNVTFTSEVLSSFHKPSVRSLIHEIEMEFDLRATKMTSYVQKSFTTYLNDEQATALQRDPRVQSIYLDHSLTYSSLWTDTTIAGETYTWGRQAMMPSGSGSSFGWVTVYVVDSGVGYFGSQAILPEFNITQRVNAVNVNDPSPAAGVGCYAHGSHVAGVIGAYINRWGTAGMDAGVPIISVSGVDPGTNDANIIHKQANDGEWVTCNNGGPDPQSPPVGLTSSGVISGLDWVYWDILNNTHHVGIVNISSNGSDFQNLGPIGLVITTTSTPVSSIGYKGALIVQAAGNGGADACTVAYDPRNAPGVIVVGGLNDSGQPATAFTNDAHTAKNEAGSNFGACVSMWAPGNMILSTFPITTQFFPLHSTNPINLFDVQSYDINYTTWAHISGTSISAPHVAGFAAYLAETGALLTPTVIKNYVNNSCYNLGTYSFNSVTYNVLMPSLQPLNFPVLHCT